METITTRELYEKSLEGSGTVLDVRTVAEFAAGHVAGAINVPHDQIAGRLAEVPNDKPVYVHCKMGGRAQRAASVLVANGYDVHCVSSGGWNDWMSQGLPVAQ